ncbi:hypothetical protein [Nocardioides sp.]|uniref:hypothetical protein n=1 Tax=Nocardioides sp. TaxID=35761 RepID=UPI002C873D33|nr:hypothetical protein [Nocardioides sp.]HXH80237.1 hypothetical protein [Nocardioides sp.]
MRLRVLLSLVICLPTLAASAPPRAPAADLLDVVLDYVAEIPRADTDAMTLPTEAEGERFIAGLTAVSRGDHEQAMRLLEPLSYTLTTLTDSVTGRQSWVVSESQDDDGNWPHGWGLYVFAAESGNQLVVEVSHPLFDVNTPQIGVEAFRRGDAQVLLMAGTHRYSNSDGSSDVAHEAGTMFARVHRAVVTSRQSVVQFHGFDDPDSQEFGDIVVSAGEPTPDEQIDPVTEALEDAGFDVCQYDGDQCEGLGGTENVQGEWCREVDARFLHVEMSREVRDDADRRSMVARIVAEELTG